MSAMVISNKTLVLLRDLRRALKDDDIPNNLKPILLEVYNGIITVTRSTST